MKWIEWIQVQTANLSEATLYDVCNLTKEMSGIPGLAAVEVYLHAVISGNILLLLHWESDPPRPRGSMVGLQLAGELKKIGLVAHSVWIGRKGEENP